MFSPVISVSFLVLRTFQILSVWCPCWITCQETKQKDPYKEKDDGIDGNLEGKHDSDQLNRDLTYPIKSITPIKKTKVLQTFGNE